MTHKLGYPLVVALAVAATLAFAPASPAPSDHGSFQPAPEHEALAEMAGRWRGEQVFYGSPPEGKPSEPVKVSERLTSICKGLWLLGRFDGARGFEGASITGFNPRTGKYQLTWVDSASPEMVVLEGTANDEGNMRTYHGLMPDRTGALRKARVVELLTGEKTRTFELAFELKEGGYHKVMSINYRKR